MIICTLECWKVRVGPRLFGTEDAPYDMADETVAKFGADVGREVFDSWIDLLSVNNLGKLVNRTMIIDL